MIYNNGDMLKGMFEQKILVINELYKAGMIPEVNIKLIEEPQYQTFIKKLVSWITDELVESSVESDKATDVWLNEPDQDIRKVEIKKYTRHSMEELMDALQFFIELFIYIDIIPDDIGDYYKKLCEERNLPIVMGDHLTTSMNYARHTNIYDDKIRELTRASKVEVDGHSLTVGEDLNWFKMKAQWDTVKALSVACRELKNKEWARTRKPVEEQSFKLKIMVGWLYLCQLLDMHGLEPKGIFTQYQATTTKILIRLENGY